MTRHLIDALHGRGLALHWSDEFDEQVVTAESIARHVRERVHKIVQGDYQWSHQVMLPELRPTGAPLTPLRIVSDPPQPSFTLTFDPESAAADTDVELTLRGDPLHSPRWPPCRHGETVVLRPRIYRIRAHSTRGVAAPDPPKVDLREMASATIRVLDGHPAPPPIDEPTPGDATVADAPGIERGPGGATPEPDFGGVHAEAQEAGAMIDLIGSDPPYRQWQNADSLNLDQIPRGTYTIRFRIGTEVYSEAEFDLLAGERKDVTPGGGRSPLLAETGTPFPEGSVVICETIGPMLASTLLTVLPLLGVLPFDTTGELLPALRPLVQPLDIATYGDRVVRVVLTVEGSDWPVAPREVGTGIRCELLSADGARQELALEPLTGDERGWGRIVHGTAPAPGRSFCVRLRSPRLGTIELAAAALPSRVTVVALAPTPDGRLDAVQHLLRVPGRPYPEPEPLIPYSRMIRELVLGQRLYGAGDLVRRGARLGGPWPPQAQMLRDLLFAKWTDPVLGCMAYYSWNDAVERGLPDAQGVAPSNTAISANNLKTYFSDLPDARVIASLAGLPGAPHVGFALEPGEVPVLAQTLRLLAGAGFPGAQQLAASVAPESSWTLIWQSDPNAAFQTDAAIGVMV